MVKIISGLLNKSQVAGCGLPVAVFFTAENTGKAPGALGNTLFFTRFIMFFSAITTGFKSAVTAFKKLLSEEELLTASKLITVYF